MQSICYTDAFGIIFSNIFRVNKRDPHIALVASKPYCPIPELYGKFRFFKPIIQKSIIEVLETKQLKEMLYLTLFSDSIITLFFLDIQQQRYIVMCTIAAIDYDMGWYYMSCKICWKRVLLVPSDHMVYGIQKSQIKKSTIAPSVITIGLNFCQGK